MITEVAGRKGQRWICYSQDIGKSMQWSWWEIIYFEWQNWWLLAHLDRAELIKVLSICIDFLLTGYSVILKSVILRKQGAMLNLLTPRVARKYNLHVMLLIPYFVAIVLKNYSQSKMFFKNGRKLNIHGTCTLKLLLQDCVRWGWFWPVFM